MVNLNISVYMATRSVIGMVNDDKTITSIYCHYDGYPEYVGKLLLNHYNNVGIINELMDLGDLSSLGENVNPSGPHSFRNPERGVCIAYKRDRGEKNVDGEIYEDLGAFEDAMGDYGCDYQYLFEGGKWMYRAGCNGKWMDLTPEVCKG